VNIVFNVYIVSRGYLPTKFLSRFQRLLTFFKV